MSNVTDIEAKMVKINLKSAKMKPMEPLKQQRKQSNSVTGKKRTSLANTKPPLAKMGMRTSLANSTSSLSLLAQKTKPSGPTIFGIMMTRQLARNYVNRFRQGRQQLMTLRPKPPTYQLEPEKTFEVLRAQPLVKNVVDARMRTFRYNPTTAALLTKILATECKDAVKSLQFPRYKYVCQVFIGEKKGQSLSVSSRCVWDTSTDNVVSYSWQSATVYCTVTLHAVYLP